MPIGIDVVVDQAYQQDVLLAFANSPIRFQITQVTWNRFREPRRATRYEPIRFVGLGGQTLRCCHREKLLTTLASRRII